MPKLILIVMFLIFTRHGIAFSSEEVSRPFSQSRNEELQKSHLDAKLLNWIKSHVSFTTQLPLSFYVPRDLRDDVYKRMGQDDSVPGIIERMIVEEGLDIYDGAVGQITLTLMGKSDYLEQAFHPIAVYWRGHVGEFQTIRAGYSQQPFVYDPQNPEAVSSNLKDFGKRGFIFRIINANGRYNTHDPLDGKSTLKGFPTWPTIHWEDWKPIAGENAWVAMAALHLFDKKFYDPVRKSYSSTNSIELQLAEELARAALLLQAPTGGIRMAPLGTFREAVEPPTQYHLENSWWYYQISTENNISWYAALRMLHQITGKKVYEEAMLKIEEYFRAVWNPDKKYFYQGMTFFDGEWAPNTQDFALDVQTWIIAALGPQKIDEWFGKGTAYQMWQTAKAFSGSWDKNGHLQGVGYTHEHDRISVEWTAGAILAVRKMAAYYKEGNPRWAKNLSRDANLMRQGIESLRTELSPSQSAYAYSSRRGWIPFGWNSHDPEVLSLASTGWVVFIDSQYNPFFLSSRQPLRVASK